MRVVIANPGSASAETDPINWQNADRWPPPIVAIYFEFDDWLRIEPDHGPPFYIDHTGQIITPAQFERINDEPIEFDQALNEALDYLDSVAKGRPAGNEPEIIAYRLRVALEGRPTPDP